MSVKIIRSGPLLTVQDRGRFGYLKYGVGNAGAMDKDAYELANALVGNTQGEAALEATLMGPELCFTRDCVCAVTGADMKPTLSGIPVEMDKAFLALKGSVLKLGFTVNGCRSYIAFSGGIEVPQVMESRSTDMKCRIGGMEGRKLQDGDLLELTDSSQSCVAILKKSKKIKTQKRTYEKIITVRVVMGPQDDAFSEKGLQTFLTGAYEVTSESDRMGIRLKGEPIESVDGVDIVSDGIAEGSIQVSNNGQPIVLMADHQTTGGYAKIATVLSVDIPLLAQAVPGSTVHFRKIGPDEAEHIYRLHDRAGRKISLWERIFGGAKGVGAEKL